MSLAFWMEVLSWVIFAFTVPAIIFALALVPAAKAVFLVWIVRRVAGQRSSRRVSR